ncbi:ribonuclease H-like domain-containing protein, partial [Tanacetum coccineum]
NQGNPLHLHANDSNCSSIVSIKLTRFGNYRICASYVARADYVASSPLFEQWDRCNVVVLNWILSSLSQDVYLVHVFSDNAASVWNSLKETYDKIYGSIVFNLLQKFNSFKQGGLPISEYYHKLSSLWREFDILTKLPDCTCAAREELNDLGHTIDKCFEIIGYPPGFKRNPNLKPSGNFNNNKTNFADTKVMKLMNLLNEKSSFSANANMAGTPVRDCRVHQLEIGAITDHVRHDEEHSATPIGDQIQSEGNVGPFLEVPVFQNELPNTTEEVGPRRPVMTPLPENIVLGHKESDIDKYLLNITNYQKLAKCPVTRRSMASTTCEVIWIVKLLGEFGIENVVPADLYCDNKSAIQIAATQVMHEKTKYFDIDVHLVREKVVVNKNCES